MAKAVNDKGASRTSEAYARGRRAYLDAVDTCPHEAGPDRLDWWTGWLDARTVERHGRDFDWANPANVPKGKSGK